MRLVIFRENVRFVYSMFMPRVNLAFLFKVLAAVVRLLV
jgi:hypothetical protein